MSTEYTLYFLFALDMFNGSMIATIFTKHVILLGGSHLFTGILGSTTALLCLIWKLIAGNLSDQKGSKRVLIWCLLPCVAGNIISCLASSMLILFFGRILCVFGSPIQVLLTTLATDVKKENQTAVVNKIGVVLALSFILGALLAGHISAYEKGLTIIYLLVSANVVISAVLAFRSLPDVITIKKNNTRSTQTALNETRLALSNLKQIYLSEKYSDVFIMKGYLDLCHGILMSNIGYTLKITFSLDEKFISYWMVILSLCSIATNLMLLKINEKWKSVDKDYYVIVYGGCLILTGYIGLYLTSTIYYFTIFFAVITAAKISLDSTLTNVLILRIGESNKGTLFSSFDSVTSLSELASPIISSLIVEAAGEKANYLSCAIFFPMGMSFSYFQRKQLRLKSFSSNVIR